MATTPQFASTLLMGAATIATAETSRTAPTNAVTIVTAGASGSKIEEIDVNGLGTVAAGLVYIWLHDGTNYHLFDELTVTATTPSTTVADFRTSKTYSNLFLATGWSLRASTTITQNLKVAAFGGSY